MAWKFPTSISEAGSPECYGQIHTIGLCKQLLGWALSSLHLAYTKVQNYEAFNTEVTEQFKQTLDDVRLPVETFYLGPLSSAGADGDVPPDDIAKRTMEYQFLAVQTAGTIGQATGEGWAANLIATTEYAVHRVGGKILDRLEDTGDALLKLPTTGIDGLQKILEALGWVGYVALGILVLIAISVAASVFKRGGKIHAGPATLST